MRKPRIPILLVAGALLAGCASNMAKMPVQIPGLTGPKPTDAEKIERLLDGVEKAVEARSVSRTMVFVSPNYKDAEGRDYAEIGAYLTGLYKGYRELRVTRVRPQIVVEGNSASAFETFGTTGTPFNSRTHMAIDVHGQVTVYLERRDDQWQITEWGRLH